MVFKEHGVFPALLLNCCVISMMSLNSFCLHVLCLFLAILSSLWTIFLTFPNTTEVNGSFALPLALTKYSNFCCFEKKLSMFDFFLPQRMNLPVLVKSRHSTYTDLFTCHQQVLIWKATSVLKKTVYWDKDLSSGHKHLVLLLLDEISNWCIFFKGLQHQCFQQHFLLWQGVDGTFRATHCIHSFCWTVILL